MEAGEPRDADRGGGFPFLKGFLLLLGGGLLVAFLLRTRIERMVFEEFHESNAASRLRGMAAEQERFREALESDADGDGKGEYGLLAELMGIPVSGRTPPGAPSGSRRTSRYGLSGAALDAGGTWSGAEEWCYALFLPGVGGPVRERGPLGAPALDGTVDADGAEVRWWAYAWPRDRTRARRAFYADASGRVLVSANGTTAYEGSSRVPAPGAAFPPGAPGDGSAAPVPGKAAADGEVWEALPRGK